MNYTDYIKPELICLALALYGLGALIKKAENINDKYIPYILLGVGVILSSLYVMGTSGFNALSIFTGVIQGILCAAVSVFGNQLIKQSSK